tara:strand:+ start:24134 stop:25900 length:1767 start_codon:yes stop_codon:yes gene_type:complete
MDYSKVNNALSGWVGPSSRRDREQAELGQAMQLMQANQQVQADREAKEGKLNEWMQHIQSQASQIAVRNEDKEVVQGLYNQEKDTFLKALEQSGNDPVKFMNSGGRKVMQTFYNNIANSDESKRIKSNTTEIQSYYESLEGNDGENAHLISNQTRRDFNSFMNGDIDSFSNKQLQQWDEPNKDDVSNSRNKVEAYLNSGDNFRKFKTNYLIEYDLPSNMFESITEEQLNDYVAGYVGGSKAKALAPNSAEGGTAINKSYGSRITKQFSKMQRKTISTDALKNGSDEYSKAVTDFDSGRFTFGSSPENTEIMGHRGFEGDELMFAQMNFGENAIADLDGGSYIEGVRAGKDGTIYDEDGTLLPIDYEIGSIQPAGVYLGYKVKTKDGYRLVKAEDLEGDSKDLEHVLVQEYQDSDWFSGKERYYIEVDTTNPTNMATLSKEKGIDSALGRYTAESGTEQTPEALVQSNPIAFGSLAGDIKPQLSIHNTQMSYSMKQMGLSPDNVVSKSLLLALASGSGGDISSSIGQLNRLFNPDSSPEIHDALSKGDSKLFFDLYLEGLISQGVDAEQAKAHLVKVDKLRDQIQKAHN